MSRDFDQKTDSLLRGFARGESGAASNRRGGELQTASAAEDASAHLDADALNLYAGNALPPAARARYTAHLADCDRCRADLIFVARAADVPAATTERIVATQAQPSPFGGWRKRLAALFAAPALRFGVPAFALLLVAVAIFFLTRTGREDNALVASRGQGGEPALNIPAPTMNSNMGTSAANTTTLNTNANGNTNSTAANMNSSQPPIESRAKAPAGDPLARSGAPTNSNAPASADSAFAPPPPPPAAPPRQTPANEFPLSARQSGNSQTPARETRSASEKANNTTADVTSGNSNMDALRPGASAGAGSVNSQRANNSTSPTATSGAAPSAPEDERARAGTRAAARKRATTPRSEADDEAVRIVESRTVAGRRFRRQNNVWIDADYNSSMSTISVARGSEQFRALAADEPILRRIANELGGEVVVRIKNRAYRIR